MTLALPLYTRRLSRKYPGLFIILLDQSRSMLEPVQGMGITKSEFATTAINELINAMIANSPHDPITGERRKYVYLSIIGYSDEAYPLLTRDGSPIDLPYLANHPLGVTTVVREILDTATGTMRQVQDSNRPIWIKPQTLNATHMGKAFTMARDTVRHWLSQTPDAGQAPRNQCFPPILVHITDGEHTGDFDPEPLAYEIRSEGTQQGATLIFNCHFTATMHQPIIFPTYESEVAQVDQFAPRMLAMSSTIPDPLLAKASDLAGRPIQTGAKGFIYNGNIELLVQFLNWGTLGTGAGEGYGR